MVRLYGRFSEWDHLGLSFNFWEVQRFFGPFQLSCVCYEKGAIGWDLGGLWFLAGGCPFHAN